MDESYRQFEDWWSKDKSQFTDDDELKIFLGYMAGITRRYRD